MNACYVWLGHGQERDIENKISKGNRQITGDFKAGIVAFIEIRLGSHISHYLQSLKNNLWNKNFRMLS
jgi:hypothetical protein